MEEKFCKDCKHFCQHYRLDERGLVRVFCGHCMLMRHKSKKSYQKICEDFEPGEDQEGSFVQKQYLTKSLLAWVLNMELLPEIRQETE